MAIWRPVSFHMLRLKDIPVVMGKANFVVFWLRSVDTPEDASLHQLYAGSDSDGIGCVSVCMALIFSATLMREIMSSTRAPMASVWSHHGLSAWPDVGSMHGLTSSGGGTGGGTGAPEHCTPYTSSAQYPPHVSFCRPLHAVVHPVEAAGWPFSLSPQ